MRRSKWITVLGMGGLGAYLLTLHTCGDEDKPLALPPQVSVFSDDKACVAAGNDREQCWRAFYDAAFAHYQRAPHFPDRAACEQAYGENNCDSISARDGSGQNYVPMLAGFALGSALGVANAVPVYYDRQGNARVAGGDYQLGRRSCDERDPQRQNCSSGGGGSGGGGHGGGYSKNRSGTQTIDTSTTNMRSVTRGGFGHSVHGASG